MKITELGASKNLFTAEIMPADKFTPAVVTLFNGWDHDGGALPVEDLDTVIQMLSTLRDQLAP